MNCPNCKSNLMMSERNGVEIDYCPECRGVWLDRGELDKIIERSNQHTPNVSPNMYPNSQTDSRYEGHSDTRYKKKKDSFLGDLFDF